MASVVAWFIFQLLCAGVAISGESESTTSSVKVGILVLNEPGRFHERRAQMFDRHLKEQIERDGEQAQVAAEVVHSNLQFPEAIGAWAFWPIVKPLSDSVFGDQFGWVLVVEEETRLNWPAFARFLAGRDASKPVFTAHGLVDQEITVIHHYAFHQNGEYKTFHYPDFAGGVLFSRPALLKLVEAIGDKRQDFTIDMKHEIAKLMKETAGIVLEPLNDHFCTTPQQHQHHEEFCITYVSGEVPKHCVPIENEQMFIGVKTFSGNHKTRVVHVKRTWAKDVRNIEFYSDKVDEFVPTVDLGVPNTERGHCGKTMAIVRRFAERRVTDAPWLVIADDDSLFSVARLRQLIGCYHHSSESSESTPEPERIVIGERYGYGFDPSAGLGYSYPTGGSGMIFSRAAAERLAKECKCPKDDSPDDMILGMCLIPFDIRLVHSATLHQARPQDYARDYLARLNPVSFHKFWEVDPYKVFTEFLQEKSKAGEAAKDTAGESAGHSEL